MAVILTTEHSVNWSSEQPVYTIKSDSYYSNQATVAGFRVLQCTPLAVKHWAETVAVVWINLKLVGPGVDECYSWNCALIARHGSSVDCRNAVVQAQRHPTACFHIRTRFLLLVTRYFNCRSQLI
ncbi:uncharacterized protein [Physcomitrium patens]|uniref:Uncharacterized protein n=1 Tax=Physcomitrium patens TaxID=3218 RepID=A0A2K1JS05_PHYPA|nr:uncharacterized protein LOC112289460 [Physcomitrium patens]PNR44313.1 hypothetical protein PHYPA_016697 [Physcomitrium patens]|eukprot:XP_024390467.1 uncharacterized protein LOC112289460 [Physcomitrella patens]